tara:strand:+ start:684 stop:1454 length:771 start_codon:yes stop_codon:yes gene_type:complete
MSDEQTLTMEEPQNSEVLNSEEQDSLQVGEQMEAEQNPLLAGKYKDPKDLEKAYNELERKLGEKSEPDSPKEESNNEPPKQESKPSDNLLDQLWEQGSNNTLTPETFDKLSKMNPVDVAKLAMQQRQALEQGGSKEFSDNDVQQIHGLVGGQENYNNMMGWANENVPEQEINMYDAVMELGNPLAAYFAVQSLALKYQDAAGRDGQMITGKAPRSTGDKFNSQAEMVKAMEDPRYNDDPAYREAVMEKLQRSDINF